MVEKEIAERFLIDLGLKVRVCEDINYRDIPCDFIGFDSENWYIVEVKKSMPDCEKSILQLLRYYDTLKWSKYNREILTSYVPSEYSIPNGGMQGLDKASKQKKLLISQRKTEKPLGKREIRLYVLFARYVGIREFEQYHTLFKTYLDNPNCPRIDFYYLGEDKPIKL